MGMVMRRKVGQRLRIDGTEITVSKISLGAVKLHIEGPGKIERASPDGEFKEDVGEEDSKSENNKGGS